MNEETKKRIAAINSGIIPEGYKKTKVGIVPVEWEDTHFSELFIEKKNVTSDFEKYPLYSLTIEEGVVPKSERYERSHLVKKDDIFKIVSENDFVYNPMNVRFGALARYKGQEDVSVSGYYDIFSVKESVSKEYMENFLLSEPMINYYNRVSTGSLKEKQRVHFSQFLDFVLPIPPLPEQQKIAEILSTQDKLIELQEKKIEQLKELKKAYLQKMFPKKGSKYPELRFKGFTDPWEQRKLGELVVIERGGSPRPIDDYITDSPDGLNWVKIGDAPEQGNYITSTKEKIRPEGLSKTREVHPGDLILSNSMSFGKPYIMAIDGCIHDGWLSIKNTNNVFDLKFLCVLLGTDQMLTQYKSMAAGSTVNNLNKELVGNTTVTYPSVEEQRTIGQFFEEIENLITLHQRKSEQEKQKKKALMQLLLTGKVRCK